MMPDREKVIAWLNEIVNTLGSFTDDSEQEVCQLAKDALALLKEQEAKTGKWIAPEEEGCLIYDPNVYVQCSVCGKKAQYGKKDKYCRNCGAKMDDEVEGR